MPTGSLQLRSEDRVRARSARPLIRIELPTSAERQRGAVEQDRSIVLVLCRRGTVTTVNAGFEQATGWRAAEWIGQPLMDLVHPSQAGVIREGFARLAQGAPKARLAFDLCLRNGSLMATEATISPYPGGESESFYCVVHDVTQRREPEAGLERSREQLRALASRNQHIREEERIRIAREIHDELGQTLTGLKMDALWLKSQLTKQVSVLGSGNLIARAETMATVIQDTIQTVRRIATDLRPPVLDKLGLPAAIEWQAREFTRRTGLKLALNLRLKKLDSGDPLSTAVFRIFQEILTNVARHAEATKIRVRLERRGQLLALTVNDDGRGIRKAEIADSNSLGLLGMRERAMVFGGKVEISGKPAGGTTVAVRVPLPASLLEYEPAPAER